MWACIRVEVTADTCFGEAARPVRRPACREREELGHEALQSEPSARRGCSHRPPRGDEEAGQARGEYSMEGGGRQRSAYSHVKCYRDSTVLSNDNVTEGTVAIDDNSDIKERYKYLRKMQVPAFGNTIN